MIETDSILNILSLRALNMNIMFNTPLALLTISSVIKKMYVEFFYCCIVTYQSVNKVNLVLFIAYVAHLFRLIVSHGDKS